VDPGLTRCGLGAVEGLPGRRVRLLAVDVVRTPADADVATRLLGISEAIEGWIEQLAPDVLAVERVFSQQNVRTVMGTAQAAGVAALAAARHGIPVAVHTPSEVKAAVTGSGTAQKAQVAAMVMRILGLAEAPRPADAADALALAICHAWRGDAMASAVVSAASGRAGGSRGAVTPAQQRWLDAAAGARRTARRAGTTGRGR
jgi:crossover junction endodeoxyribonuclease RuvC